MIDFTTTILKYGQQGDKTGWTYIVIPAALAIQLQPVGKKSFRVKGKLDNLALNGVALIPMGGGDFMMALNAELRKAIGKTKGASIRVQLSLDIVPYQVNAVFIACLEDEPSALAYFNSLSLSHQHYFSKWIESAKTNSTQVKRITQAVSALALKMGYPEMIRAQKEQRDLPGR